MKRLFVARFTNGSDLDQAADDLRVLGIEERIDPLRENVDDNKYSQPYGRPPGDMVYELEIYIDAALSKHVSAIIRNRRGRLLNQSGVTPSYQRLGTNLTISRQNGA